MSQKQACSAIEERGLFHVLRNHDATCVEGKACRYSRRWLGLLKRRGGNMLTEQQVADLLNAWNKTPCKGRLNLDVPFLAAVHPNMPVEWSREVVRDQEWFLLGMDGRGLSTVVAENPRTPSDVLVRAGNSHHYFYRGGELLCVLLSHGNYPTEMSRLHVEYLLERFEGVPNLKGKERLTMQRVAGLALLDPAPVWMTPELASRLLIFSVLA